MNTAEIGILLVNLGTPRSPDYFSVWRFLSQFLRDRRVVEIPAVLWWPILFGLILPLRSCTSAKAYQKIWTEAGSPLLVYSEQIASDLTEVIKQRINASVKVVLAMRYGSPSISEQLAVLQEAKIKKLLVFPLYPQYSSAATASVYDEVSKALRRWRVIPKLVMVNHYAENPAYITAISNQIRHYWQQHGSGEKLLFSFHGLPKRSISLGDPYYSQCHETAQLIATELQLPKESWQVVFQSRFGREEWLEPYCDKTLVELAKQDCHTVDIICPGFAADCLETLEEVAIRNKKLFIKAGGKTLNYIPALNNTSEHIHALTEIALNHLYIKEPASTNTQQ